MIDPTRIPRIMAALQAYWEGQPDLKLSELWGTLDNAGVVWGTEDEDTLSFIEQLTARHPGVFHPDQPAVGWCRTEAPAAFITLQGTAAGGVVVLRPESRDRIPGAWTYSAVRTARVGLPLVLADAAGVLHHLGVLSALEVGPLSTATFPCQRLWAARCEEGLALLGAKLEVFRPARREVIRHRVAYRRVLSATPGEEFQVELADASHLSLGVLRELVPLEPS